MKRPAFARGMWVALGVLWLAAMAVGFSLLTRHSLTPGDRQEAPSRWPPEARPPRAEGRPTLVMLAHPRCPCTRASLGELAVVMEHARGRLDARVLFLRPEGTSGDWTQGPLWRAAAEIPGVRVLADEGGTQAHLFGAVTSGHSLLYDAEGRLRFSGGLTAARGHRGDNPGRDAVEALLRDAGGSGGTSEHGVYGCALEEPPGVRATNTP